MIAYLAGAKRLDGTRRFPNLGTFDTHFARLERAAALYIILWTFYRSRRECLLFILFFIFIFWREKGFWLLG